MALASVLLIASSERSGVLLLWPEAHSRNIRTRCCGLRPLLLSDAVLFSSISSRKYTSTETPRSRYLTVCSLARRASDLQGDFNL